MTVLYAPHSQRNTANITKKKINKKTSINTLYRLYLGNDARYDI